MEIQEAESLISKSLSQLPHAPYTVQIIQGPVYQIKATSSDGSGHYRNTPTLDVDALHDMIFQIKAALYDEVPAPAVIDLDALNKEIGDLKAKVERLTGKLTDANKSVASWEMAAKLAEGKLAGIRMLTISGLTAPPEKD